MPEYPLPAELASLEARLQALPPLEDPRELRRRVLEHLADELRVARRIDRWMYAGGVAAAVVLWMNLSWMASRETSFAYAPPESLQARAEQIERLAPGISQQEALRQAVVMSLGERHAAGPAVGGPLPKPTLQSFF